MPLSRNLRQNAWASFHPSRCLVEFVEIQLSGVVLAERKPILHACFAANGRGQPKAGELQTTDALSAERVPGLEPVGCGGIAAGGLQEPELHGTFASVNEYLFTRLC